MAESLKSIYNRRHPERTDYYRIIEGSFEEFKRSYPDQFEEKYGYFTVPKILRAYFRRNRKLLKLLVQSANWTIDRYFTESLGIEGGETGGIHCIHFSLRSMQALPQGSILNVHPHLHALVPAGIMKGGVFYEQRNISAPLIAEIFRARLLCVLLEQGVITQELINMLMCWNHHSGFNVHVRGEIAGTDGDAIENIARYMSRAAISDPISL